MASGYPRENTVIYKLYSLTDDNLHQLREDILNSLSNLLTPYIWQKGQFNLQTINNCLYGEVDFDENIEDEWFVVYLLVTISKHFKNLFAEIYDEDGQFLLIEAADHLPKWMSPEVCERRVFIYCGNVHIISPKLLPEIRSPMEAGRFIEQYPEKTAASSAIMQCIKSRIGGYPGLIHGNQYSVNCFVPANLAFLLSERPQLISPGVNSFCDLVIANAKCPKIMTHFKPTNRVLFRVTMTKCQYAQLMFHRFSADRKGGWATADLMSTIGPKALDIGTKLAYGFEFACKRAQAIAHLAEGALPDDSFFETPSFNRYMQSLSKNGYFRGLLEGSRDYQRLLNQARSYYADTFFHSNLPSSNSSLNAHLLELVQRSSKINVEKMKRDNANLPPDDDDSWLYDFECSVTSISERAGLGRAVNGNLANKNGHDVPMDELVSKMNKFVNKLSSVVDGAEVDVGNGNHDCRHVDSDSESGSEEDPKTTDKAARADACSYFLYDSDEYSDDHGDSSLDEDYATDKQMKQLMKQMDDELRKANQIGRDEVRTKAASKVLTSNLVKSCQEEGSRPGPAGVLLKQLHINMPTLCQPDSDDSD